MLSVITLILFLVRRSSAKYKIVLQERFILNPKETVMHEWEVYIPTQEKQTEGKVLNFFGGGKLFKLILTSQNRLVLIDEKQNCLIFNSGYWPILYETSKKSSLHLFARVASAKVLEVQLPGIDQAFDWHVPLETIPVLIDCSEKTRNL